MIELPYGIADFRRIRQQGLVYMDRTGYLREIEKLGRFLVFLRPRRFGKSLWLQTMASYYDLRRQDEHQILFGGLEIARDPTPLAHRYFVLQWNFSVVDPAGSTERIEESLREHVASQAKTFAAHYAGRLAADIEVDGNIPAILDSLLRAIEPTPYPLYLLIDEYDNFINEVMARDESTYRALVEADGPLRLLFKTVKGATEGRGLERVFISGVSPLALNDLTSGFNIARNVSLDPGLDALCGFTEQDLGKLLDLLAPEAGTERAELLGTLRTWYNGYRFSPGPPGRPEQATQVYNPTNVLYFLGHLHRWGVPPERLYDENLRTDRGKLAFLAQSGVGEAVLEELAAGSGEVRISQLETSFSLDDLTTRLSNDRTAMVSFFYYLGLLTLTAEPGQLRIPNLVVRKLFLERLLAGYLPQWQDNADARDIAREIFRGGSLEQLAKFLEDRILPILSNRDRGTAAAGTSGGGGVNEMVLKALILAILFDDTHYSIFSELEIEQGYVDLCLIVRPEKRHLGFKDLLFELKWLQRRELPGTEKIRGLPLSELARLPPVARALTAAKEQAQRYRAALLRRIGPLPELRVFTLIAVGLERVLTEEIAEEPTKAEVFYPGLSS